MLSNLDIVSHPKTDGLCKDEENCFQFELWNKFKWCKKFKNPTSRTTSVYDYKMLMCVPVYYAIVYGPCDTLSNTQWVILTEYLYSWYFTQSVDTQI